MDKNHQNDTKDRDRQKDDQPSRKATSSKDPSHHEAGAGITNRPDTEERENQDRLPPRGRAKDEG